MDHLEEIRLVDELGSKIGYGNVMSIASALWVKGLSDWHGSDISDGAFVPTVMTCVKDDCKEIVEKSVAYDRNWVDKYCEVYGKKIIV